MAENHFRQIDAPAVVAMPGNTAHAPECPREELSLKAAVVVALMEVRTQIVTLEVGKDILNQKGLEERRFQGREATAVVHETGQRRRGGKETIEDPAGGIEDRLHVRHAAILIDLKIRHMALRAADLREELLPLAREHRLFVDRRTEVVQEIKLKEIDEAHRDLIPLHRVGARWGFYLILHAVQHHAGRSRDHVTRIGLGEIRVDRLQPHLGVQRADGEFTYGDRLAMGEERAHPKIRIDPLDSGSVHRFIRICRDRAKADPFAHER